MADTPWVELDLPPDELKIPPDLHAVPASALPALDPGKIVTWGEPDRWWLVDAGFVVDHPDDEVYLVRLFGAPEPIRIPTSSLWVYRPAMRRGADGSTVVDSHPVESLEPWSAHSWLDRVSDGNPTPPPVRRARPARELPSLSGRQLRTLRVSQDTRPRWEWVWAVSEPLNRQGGEVVVRVVDADVWISLLDGVAPRPEELWSVPFSGLWSY